MIFPFAFVVYRQNIRFAMLNHVWVQQFVFIINNRCPFQMAADFFYYIIASRFA